MIKYQYLTNAPLDEAVSGYMEHLMKAGTAFKTEIIPVAEALGRVIASAVYAKVCSPHFNACAMDGIALNAALTFGATETTPVYLSENDFVRVDTGDPLPEGCDAVVMIEDVVETGVSIKLISAAVPWQNVRQIGEDICAGDMILPSYTVITPSALGAMLAGGMLEIESVKRPVVGIIPTGDEIVRPSSDPAPGEIMEFNSAIFSGMLSDWGALSKTYPIIKDDLNSIAGVLKTAVKECDAVILIAGSSAGREDFSSEAIRKAGEVYLHGIAIKPGKPAILGNSGSVPILGLPGYPVSGIIVMEKLFKKVIFFLCGKIEPEAEKAEAVLTKRLNSSLKYLEFVRVRLGETNGKLTATPLNRGAGLITSFLKADAILEIPQNSEGIEAGETVIAELLRPIKGIKKTISVIGSHDPLIDQITDLLRIADKSIYVASSHVGSMGGIFAVKRKEAHLGGIHLLDEETGTYNIPYLKKYFTSGEVVLVEGVGRVQGFMVAKGNPKVIKGWEEIVSKNLSYVNRQKGSGTRILCDYLAKKQGIDTEAVYGYGREEYTHTGVAALIAAGSADVGLGIYSAAKIYGLDFIPVCDEQYDILVEAGSFNEPHVRRFLDILTTKEFAKRLDAMGGYTLISPGNVRRIDW